MFRFGGLMGACAVVIAAIGAGGDSAGGQQGKKPVKPKRADVERKLEIPFSREHVDARKIDVFLPKGKRNGCCIFFIHGGGWAGGDKKGWHAVMEHFCGLGYVCTSCNYRLAPKWRFPVHVEDVRLAMSWVKERAEEYGFDAKRMAVLGSSAGGHLAAMLATIRPEDDLGATAEMKVRDTTPAAAVCLCSVLSCHYYEDAHKGVYPMLDRFLGANEKQKPDLVRQASPIDRVCGKEPPFIMIVGDADDTTPVSLHEAMRDKLSDHGVHSELIVLPGVKHGFGYGVRSAAQKKMLVHVERFLGEVLLKPKGQGGAE